MAAFTTMPTFFEINAPLLYVDSLLSAMHPAGFAPSGQLFSWMSSGFQIIPRLFYQRLSNILKLCNPLPLNKYIVITSQSVACFIVCR